MAVTQSGVGEADLNGNELPNPFNLTLSTPLSLSPSNPLSLYLSISLFPCLFLSFFYTPLVYSELLFSLALATFTYDLRLFSAFVEQEVRP